MGNGATADAAAVFVAAGGVVPRRGRKSQNGHASVGINGHQAAPLNGRDAAQDGEIDGEVAVSAARRLARGRVLVLNASYEPLNVCTVRRALVLILKEKAEVLERGDDVLRSETMRVDRPEVIRLVSFVRVPRDIHRRRITRKAVLARDGWTCQYCGSSRPSLTVDHVIPRSRGGESIWENIVASCAPCNRRKGNRLPHEIRMHPKRNPRPPGPTVFIRIAAPRTPAAWEPYLLAA
ncbi:MAG: HNH endonuclease [Solirubrobacterales bacterium]|nr:HNH endonuclease [Solirubrobacterales bacterium]